MGVLMINWLGRAKAARVRRYAHAHPYPLDSKTFLGDDPRHVLEVAEHRAVLSCSDHAGVRYRYLTVTAADGRLPDMIRVAAIAELLGFTGWNRSGSLPDGWHVERHPPPDASFGVLQPVGVRRGSRWGGRVSASSSAGAAESSSQPPR